MDAVTPDSASDIEQRREMVPKPMKVKERPKSVSMHNYRGKLVQTIHTSKASMQKLVRGQQSLGRFDSKATEATPSGRARSS